MQVETPVLVRNREAGHTVLSSDPKGTYMVEWAGANDPMGNDVQPVPKEMLGLPQFHRALARGVLVLEDENDDEVKEVLERQASNWAARRARQEAASTEPLAPEKMNDMTVTSCVGPGSRPGETCGNDVVVRQNANQDKPPLCNQHAALASKYIPDDTEIRDGKTYRRWLPASMGSALESAAAV